MGFIVYIIGAAAAFVLLYLIINYIKWRSMEKQLQEYQDELSELTYDLPDEPDKHFYNQNEKYNNNYDECDENNGGKNGFFKMIKDSIMPIRLFKRYFVFYSISMGVFFGMMIIPIFSNTLWLNRIASWAPIACIIYSLIFVVIMKKIIKREIEKEADTKASKIQQESEKNCDRVQIRKILNDIKNQKNFKEK